MPSEGPSRAGETSDPKKAEALAALTIACMSALDEKVKLEGFLASLRHAYEGNARATTKSKSESDTVILAVTVAHEASVSLADLLDTAAITWEEIERERANPSPGEGEGEDEAHQGEDESA
jgi:hypothetical protein